MRQCDLGGKFVGWPGIFASSSRLLFPEITLRGDPSMIKDQTSHILHGGYFKSPFLKDD
jgi:hypothetical protein